MKRFWITLSSILVLLVLTFTSCKPDKDDVFDDFVGSSWVYYEGRYIFTLSFPNKNAVTLTEKNSYNGSSYTSTGTYTKNKNIVNMTIRYTDHGDEWIGTINGGTMTVDVEGDILIFIKQ